MFGWYPSGGCGVGTTGSGVGGGVGGFGGGVGGVGGLNGTDEADTVSAAL